MSADQSHLTSTPLAARLRPQSLADYVGQAHLLADGSPLRRMCEIKKPHTFILQGPPGVGKTSLAHVLAATLGLPMHELSAVTAGVKDIRQLVAAAQRDRVMGQGCLVFIDEIHRFNKTQQDALLPHVESGLITLWGATTENPSFQINNALLSRCRVYILKSLLKSDLQQLLQQACLSPHGGLTHLRGQISDAARAVMVSYADGDARRLFNLLSILGDLAPAGEVIDVATVKVAMDTSQRRFDAGGDQFYQQISALHKSVRGSDPDASLYWLARLLDGGCDPAYIARRLCRMASEDIGLADPRAQTIALQAWQTYERLGAPEGECALAEAAVFLACAAKSNAVYQAFGAAKAAVREGGSLPVPAHLCPGATALQRAQGEGRDYHYSHDAPNAISPHQSYLPEARLGDQYYHPVNRGLEIKLKEKLEMIRRLKKTPAEL